MTNFLSIHFPILLVLATLVAAPLPSFATMACHTDADCNPTGGNDFICKNQEDPEAFKICVYVGSNS